MIDPTKMYGDIDPTKEYETLDGVPVDQIVRYGPDHWIYVCNQEAEECFFNVVDDDGIWGYTPKHPHSIRPRTPWEYWAECPMDEEFCSASVTHRYPTLDAAKEVSPSEAYTLYRVKKGDWSTVEKQVDGEWQKA